MLRMGIKAVEIAFVEQLAAFNYRDTIAIVALEYLVKGLLLPRCGGEEFIAELGLEWTRQVSNIALTRDHYSIEWRTDILKGPLIQRVVTEIVHGDL